MGPGVSHFMLSRNFLCSVGVALHYNVRGGSSLVLSVWCLSLGDFPNSGKLLWLFWECLLYLLNKILFLLCLQPIHLVFPECHIHLRFPPFPYYYFIFVFVGLFHFLHCLQVQILPSLWSCSWDFPGSFLPQHFRFLSFLSLCWIPLSYHPLAPLSHSFTCLCLWTSLSLFLSSLVFNLTHSSYMSLL